MTRAILQGMPDAENPLSKFTWSNVGFCRLLLLGILFSAYRAVGGAQNEPNDSHAGQTSVNARWETVQPSIAASAFSTNSLSVALGAANARRVTASGTDYLRNPVPTADGVWNFETTGGVALGFYYEISSAPGLKGFSDRNTSWKQDYPYLLLNTSDAPVLRQTGEEPVAPGEVFVHPGLKDNLGVCIGFTPNEDGTYRIVGYARAIHTDWASGGSDGVEVSCFLPDSEKRYAAVTTTADRVTHTFEIQPVRLKGGKKVQVVVAMRTAYACDSTVLGVDFIRDRRRDQKDVLAQTHEEVSMSSNVNMIASWNPTEWPTASIVNGVAVSMGKTTALDGSFDGLVRSGASADLPGWCNRKVATREQYPIWLMNASGGNACYTTESPAHADEWFLHPGENCFNVCRFQPVEGSLPFDGALIFRLRDLHPEPTSPNPGEEAVVLRNGQFMTSVFMDKGSTAEVVLEFRQFGPGDTIDFVMRSRYEAGRSINCDLTALSVKLCRKLRRGMEVLIR